MTEHVLLFFWADDEVNQLSMVFPSSQRCGCVLDVSLEHGWISSTVSPRCFTTFAGVDLHFYRLYHVYPEVSNSNDLMTNFIGYPDNLKFAPRQNGLVQT